MNKEIEKSIIKTYRAYIWTKFIKGINKYKLVEPNDKIAVCISGGKDSFLLAKCMIELQKHSKIKFDLEFIAMNPGYNKENLELIKKNAELMEIPLHIFNSDIFEITSTNTEKPCYLCARMRRGYLYFEAQKLGCNKIALGHHYSDVIETTIMSQFYGGEFKTMMPKIKSTNYENMTLIRPLYLVHEDDIIKWSNFNNLKFINCACPLLEQNSVHTSKRQEIKELIKELKKTNPNIEKNVFASTHNVNLNTVISYVENHEIKSIMDIEK